MCNCPPTHDHVNPPTGQASETMAMPDKMVSGLIGKGGAVIRELMARSGAQIQVRVG